MTKKNQDHDVLNGIIISRVTLKNAGCLKAEVSLEIMYPFPYYLNYFKVMQNNQGRLWVTPPQITVDKNGKKDWRDVVSHKGKPGLAGMKKLENIILEAYFAKLRGEDIEKDAVEDSIEFSEYVPNSKILDLI